MSEPILQFFEYSELPPNVAAVCRPFYDLAHAIVGDSITGWQSIELPRNPERTVALRKLLEAREAAIRALTFK